MSYKSTKPEDNSSPVAADIRENFRALKEDDIVEGVAALGIVEGMIAAGAVTVDKLGASAVSQSKLKTSTHEQSTTATTWTGKVLTYADYGFNCRIKNSGVAGVYFKRSDEDDNSAVGGTTYVGETVYIKVTSTNTGYVIYRYVTSSGEVFWVWLLRDKTTGKIIDADACSDHCGWGQDDPNDRPHPFPNYDPETQEVLLYNPTETELDAIYKRKGKRSVLQVILEDFDTDETAKRKWPSIPVTVDILDDNWEEKWLTGKPAAVRKKVINPVSYVKMIGMKAKGATKSVEEK